ncbi:MAG: hypothetical protein ACR2KG_00540 [Nocardioidaceae bacterium]
MSPPGIIGVAYGLAAELPLRRIPLSQLPRHASPESIRIYTRVSDDRHGGLGIDMDLFGQHVSRLGEPGYTDPRQSLLWPLGRMLLHRGDLDITAFGMVDLDELTQLSRRSRRGCVLTRCGVSMPATRLKSRPRIWSRPTCATRSAETRPGLF